MTAVTPYDPDARRETPLALILKERIRRDGPMPVAHFMDACLHDPTHGYYADKTAIGAQADFITAPEISQIFGELIGLWCVAVWHQMGAPSAFNLVEFGPGRGTLMRDALRAMRLSPATRAAARVVMIESSTTLAAVQRETLAADAAAISWPGKFIDATDPQLPSIVIGNEFLDTQPVEQVVRLEHGWGVRCVSLDAAGRFVFDTSAACAADAAAALDAKFAAANPGDVCEVQSLADALRAAVTQGPHPMAALFIDYGHDHTAPGDTLQAVRRHRYEHPLTSPGEADITAQVDFEQVAAAFSACRLAVDGPATQAEFLGRLGVIERASRLMSANPARAGEIEQSVARLIAPGGMGTRFKAIGVRSPHLSRLPGFE